MRQPGQASDARTCLNRVVGTEDILQCWDMKVSCENSRQSLLLNPKTKSKKGLIEWPEIPERDNQR